MSGTPHRRSTATPAAEEGLGARYRRACRVRDEFTDSAWTLFLLRIECALADEAARELLETGQHPEGAGRRFPWRRVRRFMIETLRALPSLFWDMLCATSYPLLQLVVTLVVTTVVNLLVAAFVLYFIYKMLTVW